jgi:hypothetical protein
MNWLHIDYSLKAIHMINLLTNWLRYLLLFFEKFHLCKVANVITSFQNKFVVTTIKELELIRGGAKLAIVSCTLLLPTKLMEIHGFR